MNVQQNKLLILATDAPIYLPLIKAAGLERLQITTATDIDSARAALRNCNIILGDPPLISKALDQAPHLKWVQSSWAGVDSLCRPGLRCDYYLTGAKGIFGPLISEYVMTYLFMIERQVLKMQANQVRKNWKPLRYRPASEITLGIVGLGSIGSHLAETARHFGLNVIGLNRSGRPCQNVDKVFRTDDCEAFFGIPDYIVLTLPDTLQTRHFINAEKLGLMRSSAVLMNVGRGSIINEQHLIGALKEGVIGGAVLDVFEEEPLPAESQLWSLPNVIVTPHNAATSFHPDVVAIFTENYRRFCKQENLLHSIDFALGY